MEQIEMEKILALLDRRITVLETILLGQGSEGGLVLKVREIREEQKKYAIIQNRMIGALILINIIGPMILGFVLAG